MSIKVWWLSLLVLAWAKNIDVQGAPIISAELQSCLTAAVANLSVPTSANYDRLRQIYNIEHQFYPLAFATVSKTTATALQEIKNVLACGRQYSRRVVPRGRGHSFEGNSVQNDAIILDMNKLNSITVSTDKTTITIEAGATLGEAYYWSNKLASKAFNGGTCANVGVAGFLLGGGHGYLSRAYGMGCDQVVSFEMILYDGTTVTADAVGSYKDLFWAGCGGGGGNFGIVTKFTVKINQVPSSIQFAEYKYNIKRDSSIGVFDYFQSFGYSTDKNIGSKLAYGNNNQYPRLTFYSVSTTSGSLKSTLQASQLYKDTTLLSRSSTKYSTMSWINSVINFTPDVDVDTDLINRDWWDFTKFPQIRRHEKSFYVYQPMSKTLIGQMLDLCDTYPNALLQFFPQGGAINNKASADTAYVHRSGAIGLLQINARMPTEADRPAALAFLANMETLLNGKLSYPHGTLAAYVNYIDNSITASWSSAYFGPNYGQLQSIKSKYDPSNFFEFPVQYIRPTTTPTCKYQPCL